MLMKLSVIVTLYAMICIAAPYTGASFNPAVTMGLRALCISQTDKGDQCTKYTWVYILADFLGGALAGIVTLCHRVPAKMYTEAGELWEEELARKAVKKGYAELSGRNENGHDSEKPLAVNQNPSSIN